MRFQLVGDPSGARGTTLDGDLDACDFSVTYWHDNQPAAILLAGRPAELPSARRAIQETRSRSMTLLPTVDAYACALHGDCADVAPDVFNIDGDVAEVIGTGPAETILEARARLSVDRDQRGGPGDGRAGVPLDQRPPARRSRISKRTG